MLVTIGVLRAKVGNEDVVRAKRCLLWWLHALNCSTGCLKVKQLLIFKPTMAVDRTSITKSCKHYTNLSIFTRLLTWYKFISIPMLLNS